MNKDLQEIVNSHVDTLCLRLCERGCAHCTVQKTQCNIRVPVQKELNRLAENILVVSTDKCKCGLSKEVCGDAYIPPETTTNEGSAK